MSDRRTIVTIVLLCVVLFVLLVGADSALGSGFQFGSFGLGAGQFRDEDGVAVDQSTGDVYVVDRYNNRIDEFEADGVFVRAWGWGVDEQHPEDKLQECTTSTGCRSGEYGGGAGEFSFQAMTEENPPSQPTGIAVDSELGKEAVFVLEATRVQKFSPEGGFELMWGGKVNKRTNENVCSAVEASECQTGSEGLGHGDFTNIGNQGAIAVGPLGSVYVGDYRRVQQFSSDGIWEGSFPVVAENQVEALAVTSSGNVCLTINPSSARGQESPPAEVRCYTSSGVLEHTIILEEKALTASNTVVINLATDGSGHLFVDEYVGENQKGETARAVMEYDATFKQLKRFAGESSGNGPGESSGNGPKGLALVETSKTATGLLFASYRYGMAVVRSIPVPPPGPTVESEQGVADQPSSTATLKASVNPQGKQTKYHFDYGLEERHETESPSVTLSAEGFKPETVELNLSGLKANTLYHYHVVVENKEGTVAGEDAPFATSPPTRIDSLSVGKVTAESATLEAEIDPLASATEYSFEYAAAGEAEHQSASLAIGAGTSDVPVSMPVQGLSAHTLYTYRVVASNGLGAVEAQGEFTTQAVGGSATLPDGREWELVSPPATHGALILPLGSGLVEGLMQGSVNGDAIAYTATSPVEAEPQGYDNGVTVLSTRGADGWSSQTITPPHEEATLGSIGEGDEFRAFSEDLSLAVVQPFSRTPLSPLATEYTPYLRRDFTSGEVNDRCVMGCFEPLVDAADVPPGTKIDGEVGTGIDAMNNAPTFVGATPELNDVVLSSEVALTSTPAKTGGLYEWTAGRLRLISELPADETNDEGGSAAKVTSIGAGLNVGGGSYGPSRGAVSSDGSRIVWTGSTSNSGNHPHLYLRDGAETVRLDLPQGGSGTGESNAPVFVGASSDDSRVFFLDKEPLTVESSASTQGADLYEYDVDAPVGSRLTDLSVDPNVGEAAGVTQVLGLSEDGSYVYFAAAGALAPGATPGECGGREPAQGDTLLCNVYVRHDGQTTFVAGLSQEDFPDWAESLNQLTARVSPNGEWLVFQSQRSLTGYDTRDAVSGVADEEVYLYSTAAGGRLVCASCDPTGARPVGAEYAVDSLVGADGLWQKSTWLAGAIPPWTQYYIRVALHQARYLSDSGRLFFAAHDGLVPQAVNGNWDVYEYEPPGVGDCSSALSTFSEQSGGCVGLISSGSSAEESAFLDASETGGDVFFLTSAKLVPQAYEKAFAVYDAHECTSGSPCFPAPVALPPPCGDGEGCKGAQTPQPSIFGSPASAMFSGVGNVVLPPSVPNVVSKSLTRAQKLARALKACARMRSTRKRAACEKQARRAYGAKASRVRTAGPIAKRGKG